MSSSRDHIRSEWLHIPYEDSEVYIPIGGFRELFSTADSAVWLYPDYYSAFNNIVREEKDDSYSRWFNPTIKALDALHEAGITHIYPPYPSKEVIAGFWAIEMAHYDQELEAGVDLD